MSWDDHNRRRTAIKSVLDYAAENPGAPLPFDRLPEVSAIFRDRRELVLALQYDWSQALWAHIELLSLDLGKKNSRLTDAAQLAGAAWAQCATKHPVLRRLLDDNRELLGPGVRREQDILLLA